MHSKNEIIVPMPEVSDNGMQSKLRVRVKHTVASLK